jgi:hypothetical protein
MDEHTSKGESVGFGCLRRLQSVYTIAEKRIPKKINIQNDKLQ